MSPTQRKVAGAALVLVALVLFIAGSSPAGNATVAGSPSATVTVTVTALAGSQAPERVSEATSTASIETAPRIAGTPGASATVAPPVAPTRTPRATNTPQPTSTPTPLPTPTPRFTATPSPTPTPTETPTPVPSPTPDPLVVEAVAAVQGFNPSDPATLARLDAVISAAGNVVPSLEFLLYDENPDRRYAALYVIIPLTRTPEDVAVLRGVLADPNPGFRVLAAGALAGRGVVESLPVLIDGLSLQQGLPYSDPPRPLAQFSRQTLEFFTGESFDTAEQWRAWWESVRDRIVWTGAGYAIS